MMQNGFRRIALAQGLLPERLSARQDSDAPAEPCEVRQPDAADAADASSIIGAGTGAGEPEGRVACVA